MKKAALNVVDFPLVNLRDVAGMLRNLADKIEANEYGDVGCCAVSMLADKLCVFGFGSDAQADAVICTLQAGALKLLRPVIEHGESE